MRALFILIFVAFSMGAMATFERSGTDPEASVARIAQAPSGTLSGAVAVVRKVQTPAPSAQEWSDPPAGDRDGPRFAVGEVLPEGTELHMIPRHESYRYAVVQGQRAIVDAASRQIVYIIR